MEITLDLIYCNIIDGSKKTYKFAKFLYATKNDKG